MIEGPGVYRKDNGPWQAAIVKPGSGAIQHLGEFESREEAVAAYRATAAKYYYPKLS
jgi:hypothetical protein